MSKCKQTAPKLNVVEPRKGKVSLRECCVNECAMPKLRIGKINVLKVIACRKRYVFIEKVDTCQVPLILDEAETSTFKIPLQKILSGSFTNLVDDPFLK